MKALSGIRILDLTHMLSGPYGSMLLADLGAETIKIEPPLRGEGTRKLLANDPDHSVNGMGAYFLTLNRNKKSVTIDLKSQPGKELFYELVAVSDVIIYNFSAGVADRLEISRRFVGAVNPRIITCSITGFGETGPHKDMVSFDMVAQGMGGGMSLTGEPASKPIRAGIPIGDLGGGMMGALGVLAALQARERTGRGQHVDISMQDAQISLLNYIATMYNLSGRSPGQLGNAHHVHVPYNTFPTRDGWIIVAVVVDSFWQTLMTIVDCPDLDSEENRTQPGRYKNREVIDRRLSESFATKPRDHWITELSKARIPCAPVYDVGDALDDRNVLARNMMVEVDQVEGGPVRMPGNPVKLSETHEDTFSSPPLLGQHTDEILAQLLGKSAEEIADLRRNSVI
ncbi:MAG: CoA transferase [Proteobacteria bacterium]|nr:CoA transferase [Pseudomonadota bacterium]